MSQSRLVPITGCLLAALLACVAGVWAPSAWGQGHAARGRQVPASYVPKHERTGNSMPASPYASPAAPILGQIHQVQYENEGLAPVPMEGAVPSHGHEVATEGDMGWGDETCGPDGCDPCECDCGVAGCRGCGLHIFRGMSNRTEFYSGVSSFSSPVNRGGTGSFGFEGGLNMGTPLFNGWQGLGFQAGLGGTLSNFNGANFTRDDRGQVFITMGLFRRVDWGLQGGLVVDHVHDDWYANVDLSQLRGELSWAFAEGIDTGFWFAASNDDDQADGVLQTGTGLPTTVTETWQVNNLYAAFARGSFCNGEARVYAGWTGNSAGLLGGDVMLPINDTWSVRSSFAYVLPEQGPLDGGAANEAWNLSMLMVWQPCGRGCGKDYYRPLMNVANNASMILNR